MAAGLTFNGALALSGNRGPSVPVVQVPPPALPLILPPPQLKLPSPAIDSQLSKPKIIDEASAYDEARPRHAKRRSDESRAYAPPKKPAQPDPAKTNPVTNW